MLMLGGPIFDGRWQHQQLKEDTYEVVLALRTPPSKQTMQAIRDFLAEGFRNTEWHLQSCQHVRYTVRLVLRKRAAMRA